jgi:hypothetical protein
LLTGDTVFATVLLHTVNKKAQQHRKTLQMKTKTILIAAAALAAGVISSQAQVYSQNIVGYVNVPLATGYTLVANPLDDGNGNQLTNLVSTLANKSQIVTWNGTSYNGAVVKAGGVWGGNAVLAPGTGFFVKVPAPITNTFVGTVGAVGLVAGSTVTNSLAIGYNLVGSPVAFAGDATTDTNVNLGASLANKSQLVDWNSGTQAFDGAVVKAGGVWGSAFNITVGEGFFVKSPAVATWVQTLP